MSYAGHRGLNTQDRTPREGEYPVNDTHNWVAGVYFPLIAGDTGVY